LYQFLLNIREEIKDNHDSLIIYYSGHGKNDCILCSDGNSLYYKNILNIFDNCNELIDKPILLFSDSCRGDKEIIIDDIISKTTLSKNGIFKNLYIHYSTINGYVSYCDANNGSIFTQALYNVFKDYEMDLNQLSIKIKHEMKKKYYKSKGIFSYSS